MQCPKCKKETEHIHIIDTPYGLGGAYMSGTEHYECVECGTDVYKTEGEKQGLKFIMD